MIQLMADVRYYYYKKTVTKTERQCWATAKVTDITENQMTKNCRNRSTQLPRVLDDKDVTIAVINNNFAAQAS
jgi:ABC-type metal ion transport system substrate-binding protein